MTPVRPKSASTPPATPASPPRPPVAQKKLLPAETDADAFDAGAQPRPSSAPVPTELLAKFGLVQEKQPNLAQRFASNVKKLVSRLAERTTEAVKHAFSVMGALGLAVRDCSSMHDVHQLYDFAKLAIKNGQPLQVFSILKDVAGFILEHPDEARRVMRFVKTQEQDTWKQRSMWMRPALVDLNALPQGPPQKTDVAIIGGGISAAYMSRYFAQAQQAGEARGQKLLVLEMDSKEKREHMASLRNAGIVCTALDYIFDIDEVIGDKAIGRIQTALACDEAQAKQVYSSLMQVMHDATGVIEQFLREKNVDVELKKGGGLDIAHTADDVEHFKRAAKLARQYGLDWKAIDAQALKADYGVDSPAIAGALLWNDSSQLNPGKLVKALFDYAAETSKNVSTSFDTEVVGARQNERGDGWILKARKGGELVEIHAKEVIDAREAYAPYHFREARFSQIHIIDTSSDERPMELGDTQLCHGFTYMRKVGDNKFLVGSGDFPLSDPKDTPPLMASVALYAFANFMKVFPDAKFDLERAWGGVFGLNRDEIPCVGELLDGWQVVGGSGGSGMNLTPALGEQAIANVLGRPETGKLSSRGFSPRHYSLIDIRQDLAESLQRVAGYGGVELSQVKLEIGPANAAARQGDDLVFTIDTRTLDAASILAAPLFGDQADAELKKRVAAKAAFIDAMVARVADGVKEGRAQVASPARDRARAVG